METREKIVTTKTTCSVALGLCLFASQAAAQTPAATPTALAPAPAPQAAPDGVVTLKTIEGETQKDVRLIALEDVPAIKEEDIEKLPQDKLAELAKDGARVAAEEKNKAEVAESQKDLLKNGKLMAIGLTGGAAFAVQTPLRRYGQQTVDVVAMPYLLMLPGYFGSREPLRQYCASAWGIGTDSAAHSSAKAAATNAARQLLASIEANLAAGVDKQVVRSKFLSESDVFTVDEEFHSWAASTIDAIDQLRGLTPAQRETEEAKLLDALVSFVFWHPTWSARGACLKRSIGIWVGLPAAYEVTTKLNSTDTRTSREIKPDIAFGLGYTPHAYLTLLAGATVASVETPDDSGLHRTVWAGTFAVGGNIDLLGELFK